MAFVVIDAQHEYFVPIGKVVLPCPWERRGEGDLRGKALMLPSTKRLAVSSPRGLIDESFAPANTLLDRMARLAFDADFPRPVLTVID